MKNILQKLLLVLIVLFPLNLLSQQIKLEVPIKATGGSVTDTLDNGKIVTFLLSTDDAEQEADAVDSPYDDDLDAGWEGDPEDQFILTLGLRFRELGIPKGAKIDSAYIILHAHEGKSAEDIAKITIYAHKIGFAPSFDEANFTDNYLLTDRPRTNAEVKWTVAEDWTIWKPYQTPDLKNIIQEVVGLDDWKYGNPIAFIFKGEDQGPSEVENAREFNSFENIADPEDSAPDGTQGDGQNHPERVPKLVVYYTTNTATIEIPIRATGGVVTDTLDNGQTVTFELSTDDAEQEGDAVDSPYDDDLDAGWEGDPEDQFILTMGLRFRDVFIPKNSTINTAYVILHAHEGKSTEDVSKITIFGEASDFAPTYDETNFNDNYLLTDRPRTNAEVKWTVAEDWTIWKPYSTPDLKSIVQEIVNRPNWKSGNPISLIFTGEDQGPSEVENAREFNSFENIADPEDSAPDGTQGDGQNHPDRVPKLVITYTVNGTDVEDTYTDNSNVKIYPNPSIDGIFNIKFENADNSVVSIFDIEGTKLIEKQFAPVNEIQMNLANVSNGVYVVKVQHQGITFNQKIIVSK